MPRLTFESTVFKIINAQGEYVLLLNPVQFPCQAGWLSASGLRPKLLEYAYGTPYQETQSYSYMVTEKLGSNLETLLKASGGSFTVSTTMKLAINLVRPPGIPFGHLILMVTELDDKHRKYGFLHALGQATVLDYNPPVPCSKMGGFSPRHHWACLQC